jgi:hypothetical protein
MLTFIQTPIKHSLWRISQKLNIRYGNKKAATAFNKAVAASFVRLESSFFIRAENY